ncbi:unnamed protein product [Meloidogyne enterolobii]|uniref:Uncharacterized protein n=1 Tax=Meloidogyne enterolobii TaxID=390850 RepID=A0ACB1B1U1_MELEN
MVDTLHSLTIFCRASPSFNKLHQRSILTSGGKAQQPQSTTKTNLTPKMPPTYKNNFNEAYGGIESILMSAILGPLLSKLTASSAELWQPENMSLAQDSAMSAKTINRIGSARCPWSEPPPSSQFTSTTINTLPSTSKNKLTTLTTNNNNQQSLSIAPAREYAASLRRGLFRKREWMQTTLTKEELTGSCGGADSDGGVNGGGGDSTQSTPPLRIHPSTSMDDSSLGSPQPQTATLAPKKGGGKNSSTKKGGGATGRLLGLLKGARHGTTSSDQTVINFGDDDGSLIATSDEQQTATNLVEDDRESSLGGGGSLDAGSVGRGGGGKSNTGSNIRATPPSRLAAPKAHFGIIEGEEKGGRHFDQPSASSPQNIPNFLPQRKFVQIKEIREGAARFAFILENSKPGTFPDAPLIAALPELKSTVLSRAVLLLECIHFVHRCNNGAWPDWIRSGMSLPGRLFTSSATGSGGCVPQTPLQPQSSIRIGGGGGASRRTALMQRAIGRALFSWAFQLGIRLQRQLDLETELKSTAEIRNLKLMDELEDFLDDGTVNTGDKDGKGLGTAFPVALQLMVCMLLQQITSFLRETFQLLPRSRQLSQKANSAVSSGWERLQSNRRWSILSNTFNPQMLQQQQHLDVVSGSVHSINELHPERRISYSTADDENSPRGSHDLVGEEQHLQLLQQQQILEKTGKVSTEKSPYSRHIHPRSNTQSPSSLSSTFLRFASRSRLFGKVDYYSPLMQNDPTELINNLLQTEKNNFQRRNCLSEERKYPPLIVDKVRSEKSRRSAGAGKDFGSSHSRSRSG